LKKKAPTRRPNSRAGAVPPPSLLASALASLGEGVLVLARPLRKAGLTIVQANAAFCRMTGYAAADLAGRGHGLLHVEPADRERLSLWLRAGADHPLSGESFLKRQDGGTLSAAWTFSVIADSGKPGYIVAIYRDTAERRGLQKIQGHTQRLEAVGRLAGGVAHDFNNLISVINVSGPDGEKLAKALHHKSSGLRVLNACNHNAWQTLAWLPVAHQAALPRPFALSELLKAVRRLLDA
jgi:PAS domain S-box-containing protein